MSLDGRPLSSWIETWASHQPDREALSFGSQSWDYRGFVTEVDRWVAVLAQDHGVGPGDRVAYLGHNHPSQLFVLFACARLGAALVPLNWRLTATELAYQLHDCEPVVVVAAEPFEATVLASPGGGATSWPVHGLEPRPHESVQDDGAHHDPHHRGRPSDPLLIVYTSGTTGYPKGAVLDQRAVLATALNGWFAHDLTSGDRVLTVLPMFHVGGLCIQTVPALLAGGAVRVHAQFDPAAWLADVQSWRPTTSLLVPATMAAITRHPDWSWTDLSSLRGIMTGSSVIPQALIAPFHERGVACGQVYGATETGPTALVLRFDEAIERVGSCGKPVPHCQVRLVDRNGVDVAEGERGELVVRGPNVSTGYWRNAEATAEAFLDGGWFRTGDIGHCDEAGWWYIDDRRTDVIISGGENIYPAELEEVLASCPDIVEAAVIGCADERWGEVAVALVVVRRGASLDEGAVRALFEGRLARFKHPRLVRFGNELPRNVMGKVQSSACESSWPPGVGAGSLEARPIGGGVIGNTAGSGPVVRGSSPLPRALP